MTELEVAIRQKTYANGVCAIRDLAFDIPAGQFCAIVGPSGAGKTTLLNIIAGLDRNVDGQVRQTQHNGARTGFMFQQARLLPWLTVRQNIELVIEGLATQLREAARQRVADLLQQVGLAEFHDAFPRQLSIGMQRRVALARTFLIQPDLLLMDEPFQSLDEPTADQLRALLLDLWQETRSSVLFVTHNLREALTLADRVLFLSNRPARVVLDYAVTCERPREPHSNGIHQIHDQLMQAHPQLLSGLTGT